MKKIVSMLLVMAICCGLLMGCGGSKTATGTVTSEDNEEPKQEEPKLEVSQQKYYVYDDGVSGYAIAAFCEIKNTGNIPVGINSVTVQYEKADGTSLGDNGYPEFAPLVLEPGEIGFVVSNEMAGMYTINAPEDVAKMNVSIDYGAAKDKQNVLNVSNEQIVDTPFNPTQKGVSCTVNNPGEKDTEYFTLLVGMYDASGNLIGVTFNSDMPTISAGGDTICKSDGWLMSDASIWDKVASLKGVAYVTSYME